MSTNDQTKAFADEVANLIDRYRSEFDLPLAVYVGVLTIHANALVIEQMNQNDP